MDNPTVREILDKWLTEHGYDGLYDDDCGCEAGDLAPCDCCRESFNCKAGHKIPCDPETCPADGHCPWHIGKKTDNETSKKTGLLEMKETGIYPAWRPKVGEKFRAWCKRGGGEFFAGQFGPLICTRITACHVLAAPSKGVHPDYINTEMLQFDRIYWRFVAE